VSEPHDFNPNSVDSQLATIISRLNGQDVYLRNIHAQTKLTNGRVTKLERYVAMILGGWFVIITLWAVYSHFVK
jgi:hypothetical protein